MSAGPLAAQLVLLDNLVQLEQGTKVRFLGCVVSTFSPIKGRLILQHPLAANQNNHEHDRSRIQAHVDLDSIGPELSGRDMTRGNWLNVVGYVEHKRRLQHGAAPKENPPLSAAYFIDIQALMVWSAGSLDVGAYEMAVRARQHSGKLMKSEG